MIDRSYTGYNRYQEQLKKMILTEPMTLYEIE